MPDIQWYLGTLIDGVNRNLNVAHLMRDHAGGENRSLLFEVRDRFGRTEAYGFLVDFGRGVIEMVEPWQVKNPTATLTMADILILRLLDGKDTLTSMALKGYPLDIRGPHFLRDLVFLDELLAKARRSMAVKEAKAL